MIRRHMTRLATLRRLLWALSTCTTKPFNSSIQLDNASVFSPSFTMNRCVSTSARQLSTKPQPPLSKKLTSLDLLKFKQQHKAITMCTAYSFSAAQHVDRAKLDVLLVGDSLAMVEQGMDNTLSITLDETIYHCKAVVRGAGHYSLLCADLPFGSYESSPQQAFASAVRLLKEGGMDCVKLEGGRQRADSIRHLTSCGIAVIGHIGLTPQSISVLGGFRAQGKTLDAAVELIQDAIALQDAGCCAIVLECIPAQVAQQITSLLHIPTIGIGAGQHCDGQVLVYHDLLGMFHSQHHAVVAPSFCKRYAQLGEQIHQALTQYKTEVENREFPSQQYSPYKMLKGEAEKFTTLIKRRLQQLGIQSADAASTSTPTPTPLSPTNDEQIKVY